MESLAALGLAANVLQLIDVSAKVVSVFRKGSTVQNADLAKDVKYLKSQLNVINGSGSYPNENKVTFSRAACCTPRRND